MDFTEAIIAISKRKDMSICDDKSERTGKYDICVYKNGYFVGKLRWPAVGKNRPEATSKEAHIDEGVEKALTP